MTPEAVGFAMQTLLDAGAPEVWTTPVGMKKNRPGILLTCLCRQKQRDEMVRLLFRHTSTIGVRESVCRRWVLRRESGEVTIYANMIQTDAAINPGNSGGALVNSNGELIGINTLITSYSGNYSGVGFAIPVNYALPIAEKLIKGETPTHAQLGVTLSSVTPSVAQRNGLSANYGAYVTSVNEGTGASEAGLQPGDIIVSFNGAKVESSSDVMVDIRACNPGDTVTLGINRDGKTLELSVKLGESGGVAESSGLRAGGFRGRTAPVAPVHGRRR
jgi:S1-C subfamily serine protease